MLNMLFHDDNTGFHMFVVQVRWRALEVVEAVQHSGITPPFKAVQVLVVLTTDPNRWDAHAESCSHKLVMWQVLFECGRQ